MTRPPSRRIPERLLRENGGNRSKTARMPAIGRTTLWRRLRAHPLQPSPQG
ncbi:MAG: helix-turn-helix domain-containing protein [Candidatus Methylomirabilales bacterium]